MIRTARLSLRSWNVDDDVAFFAIHGDPRVIWWGHVKDQSSPPASCR